MRRGTTGSVMLLLGLCLAAGLAEAASRDSGPFRLAQAAGITDLLKGGPGDAQEGSGPGAPPRVPSQDGFSPTDLLRGGPAPADPEGGEATVEVPVPAAPPVRPFPETALVGTWTGAGTPCAERKISFERSDTGYPGTSRRVNARTGTEETTRMLARHDRSWQSDPHPLDESAFFAFARQYVVQVSPPEDSAAAPGTATGWSLTLLVSRDAESRGLVLRFVAPVTACTFAREEG